MVKCDTVFVLLRLLDNIPILSKRTIINPIVLILFLFTKLS